MSDRAKHLDDVLEVLLAFARHDFSQRAPVHGNDTLDAIAAGLNMLAEELHGTLASRRELEAAYADLKEAEAKLVHASRMAAIGQLASAVAHEVNNPATWVSLALSNMRRSSTVLRRALDEPEIDRAAVRAELDAFDEILGDAVEGIERISAVVGDLRTFSRADDETFDSVCIDDVVRTSCNLAGPTLRSAARVALDLGEPPPILANRGRLAQVVTNLLINAAHAVNEAGPDTHEIRVTTRLEGDDVLLVVEDTGRGIAPEHRARVFDPFFTTKPPHLGTGLGLTIVHQIVDGMGGSVRLADDVPRGARFEVRLPVSPVR